MKLWQAVSSAAALSALLSLSAFGAVPQSPEVNPNLDNDVQKAINTIPYYGVFDNLAYTLGENGVVTLEGSVMQYYVRNSAVEAVKHVPGVTNVVDKIEVLPLSPFDNNIRIRAYYAVFGDPSLSRYAINSRPLIRILVKNGNITLTGVVSNEFDRELVYNRVAGLPGAFSVTNALKLDSDL